MAFIEKYSTLIIILTFLIEAVITASVILHYMKIRRQAFYSHENPIFLGGSIFTVVFFAFSAFMLPLHDTGVVPAVAFFKNLSTISALFPMFALPVMLIFFLFMGISNLSLIRHEGKSLKKLAGSILGFLLVFATIACVFGWDIIYNNIIFKIYSKGYSWITVFDIAIPHFLTSLLCYFECLLIGVIASGVKATKVKPDFNKDYVVILGCAIKKDGTPTPLLRGRVDRALAFSADQIKATGKKIKFVVSGGQGSDECISEAQSMKNYLLTQGVDESDIIVENKSTTTLENMRFSKTLIDEDNGGENIIFSTTNYHIFRSGIYAKKAGLDAEGIGSKTKWYFWPNAFVREFVALVVSRLKGHLVNSAILLLLSIFIGYISYITI